MFKTNASNITKENYNDDTNTFLEKESYESLTPVSSSHYEKGVPVKTPPVKRVGEPIRRKKVTARAREDLGVGSSRIGSVTVIGNGTDTTDIDALRQGKNIRNFNHFSKGTLPFVTVNTPELDTTSGHFTHQMMNQSYGQGSLFKINNEKGKLIPFEDFPGRLDPVAYVNTGDYILQYMIINDLTRDIDKFIDPDTLDGVIEVFEIRQRFANTSVADISLSGLRADMSLGDANYSVKGSNFMSSKKEKIQKNIDFYMDSEETLFGQFVFHAKGKDKGDTANRKFALDGFIHDEFYQVTPFIESSNLSTSFIFVEKLENFAKQNKLNFPANPANSSKRNFSDIGSRFTATNSGFIFTKSNIIGTSTGMSSNVSGITIDLGTDSLAFGGFVK